MGEFLKVFVTAFVIMLVAISYVAYCFPNFWARIKKLGNRASIEFKKDFAAKRQKRAAAQERDRRIIANRPSTRRRRHSREDPIVGAAIGGLAAGSLMDDFIEDDQPDTGDSSRDSERDHGASGDW